MIVSREDYAAQIATLWVIAASQPLDFKSAFIFLNSIEGSSLGSEQQARYSALHACFLAALDQTKGYEEVARVHILNLAVEMRARQAPG